MSQTATKPLSERETSTAEAASLLEKLLEEKPYVTGGAIATALTGDHIDRIRALLPTSLKDEAERFVKRGVMYFSRKPELEECTIASKIKCILDAAELGLALDGRLCHAVSYNVKYKDERNVERWRKEVQCQPDYKGLTVVAKRTGQILDVYADIVCANDQFRHGRKDAMHYLEHTYAFGDRGDVIGAYAIVKLPGEDWRYDLMQRAELDAIQARSKAKSFGPWVTDPNEMRKKTVIRRILKMYSDDPGVAKAIELLDRDYGSDDGAWIPPNNKMARISDLGNSLTGATPRATHQQCASNAPHDGPLPADDLPVFEGDPPQSDEPPPTREPGADDETYLSEAALAFEEKLNDPAIDKQQNAAVQQEFLAAPGLSETDKNHLKGLVKRNAERLKGKK